jgi:hypothetical protein
VTQEDQKHRYTLFDEEGAHTEPSILDAAKDNGMGRVSVKAKFQEGRPRRCRLQLVEGFF